MKRVRGEEGKGCREGGGVRVSFFKQATSAPPPLPPPREQSLILKFW